MLAQRKGKGEMIHYCFICEKEIPEAMAEAQNRIAPPLETILRVRSILNRSIRSILS
jgi:hypothetical protein